MMPLYVHYCGSLYSHAPVQRDPLYGDCNTVCSSRCVVYLVVGGGFNSREEESKTFQAKGKGNKKGRFYIAQYPMSNNCFFGVMYYYCITAFAMS